MNTKEEDRKSRVRRSPCDHTKEIGLHNYPTNPKTWSSRENKVDHGNEAGHLPAGRKRLTLFAIIGLQFIMVILRGKEASLFATDRGGVEHHLSWIDLFLASIPAVIANNLHIRRVKCMTLILVTSSFLFWFALRGIYYYLLTWVDD